MWNDLSTEELWVKQAELMRARDNYRKASEQIEETRHAVFMEIWCRQQAGCKSFGESS